MLQAWQMSPTLIFEKTSVRIRSFMACARALFVMLESGMTSPPGAVAVPLAVTWSGRLPLGDCASRQGVPNTRGNGVVEY